MKRPAIERHDQVLRNFAIHLVKLELEAASHLFQVISRRYEKGATILTTNRGIASWGEIFEDTTVAAAVLDRLLHRATVVHIDGESYRMRAHERRSKGYERELQGVGKFRDRKWGILVILDTHLGLGYRTPKEVRKTWEDAQEQDVTTNSSGLG